MLDTRSRDTACEQLHNCASLLEDKSLEAVEEAGQLSRLVEYWREVRGEATLLRVSSLIR